VYNNFHTMKLGAHLSIAGGYTKALEKIVTIGGNCLQIFSTSPRGWEKASITPQQIEEFKTLKERLKVNPVYFHASYLINLADDGPIGQASKQSLIAELNLADQLGVKGSIIHLGSFKTADVEPEQMEDRYKILINNINHVLEHTPKETLFIIENAGTRKIGLTVDEIARIISAVQNPRVRVCFDTCHLHNGGYNLSTPELLEQFFKTFDSFIGLGKLELWHMNDSKDPFGARRDRHENIGKGTVGENVFKLLLNHPSTKKTPFIIETPGFDEKGPDKENLDILKSFIEGTVVNG
jgi:deoxyribonuclease-4